MRWRECDVVCISHDCVPARELKVWLVGRQGFVLSGPA